LLLWVGFQANAFAHARVTFNDIKLRKFALSQGATCVPKRRHLRQMVRMAHPTPKLNGIDISLMTNPQKQQ